MCQTKTQFYEIETHYKVKNCPKTHVIPWVNNHRTTIRFNRNLCSNELVLLHLVKFWSHRYLWTLKLVLWSRTIKQSGGPKTISKSSSNLHEMSLYMTIIYPRMAIKTVRRSFKSFGVIFISFFLYILAKTALIIFINKGLTLAQSRSQGGAKGISWPRNDFFLT